ncbi:MSHA biogenesis protein MshI [Pseudoalteromonas sp. CO325X]|uniref:MSHA biogenesis protein MshI n=1 Tax=Pseudoalteromonas sp. CO325X TaxID=1777262 RepID=UPI001023B5C1|nr:MSHA biogenesis protein MshI [Pseudoalteromonas sp. CO325X]RZF80962.1 MSHA biogenesis protein MshI [Pseudoalteromonas sp. CO325X]
MAFKLLTRVPWLNSKKKSEAIVGVALYADVLRAVQLKQKKQQWFVSDTEELPLNDLANYSKALLKLLRKISSDACDLYVVLPQSYYQIVQAEKPELSEQEITQSLPWTLKDLVSISAENIIADYIDYPIQSTGQKAKINVFATDKQQLRPLVSELDKLNDCHLQQLSVKETTLAAMTAKDNYARLVVYQEPGDEPSVLIIRDQQLLLNRRLRGFSALQQQPDETTLSHLSDSLGLEIQRSMDFYESQLKQPPIKEILIQGIDDAQAVISRLQAFQTTSIVEFKPVMDLADVIDPKFHMALAGAYFPMLEQA